MNVTTVAGQSGTAAGDMSGYVLSFTGSEYDAAPLVANLTGTSIVTTNP